MNMITVDREPLEQALEELEQYVPKDDYENKPVGNVMDALRARLKQPDQIETSATPVKYEARRRHRFSGEWYEWSECPANTRGVLDSESVSDEWEVRALYTSPQPSEWNSLSDEEIDECFESTVLDRCDDPSKLRVLARATLTRAIEDKLREKNRC
jgi:hypothetical protein